MLQLELFYKRYLHKFLITLIIIFLSIFPNHTVSQDFPTTNLEENATLLDFKNNEDTNFIATTKNLYSGLNPVIIVSFKEALPSNVVFTKYENSSYLTAACTKDYLLSYFLSGFQNETKINLYSSFNLESTNNICSISYMSSNAHIIHTKIEGKSVKLTTIKHKLNIYKSGLSLGNSPYIIHSTLSLSSKETFPYISCESILVKNNENEDVLVCSFINVDSINENINSYIGTTGNYTSYPYHFNERVELFKSDSLLYFKLVRINSTFMRYIIGNNS